MEINKQLDLFRDAIAEQNDHFTIRRIADYCGFAGGAFIMFFYKDNDISLCSYYSIRNWLVSKGYEFENLIPQEEFTTALHFLNGINKYLKNPIVENIFQNNSGNFCCVTKLSDACQIMDTWKEGKRVGVREIIQRGL